MKTFLLVLISLFPILSFAQSTGDTIVIQTIDYSQTFTPNGRDTMILFPDNPGQTYEKIIMAYNMRCKDGNVSVPGNTNLGCGEWDYKCNTYITDSSRVDSVINYLQSHSITHFSGDTFYYTNQAVNNYYQHLQKQVEVNNIISENQSQVGNGDLNLAPPINADHNSGKSQYLYLASELIAAGATTGNIDGVILDAGGSSEVDFLRVKMKHTTAEALYHNDPDIDGFTEVFFQDYVFEAGLNRIQFFEPFDWDGESNVIVEFSFTNDEAAEPLTIKGDETLDYLGIFVNNGTHLYNDVGHLEIPAEPMANISQEITVSFWAYGSEEFLPATTSIISGVDENNNRQLNIHLPWSNSSVYFDCGYDGGYDRINKAATPDEIKGRWNHWAFTKNANTGEMKIFLNGDLWHSGTGKTNLINIQNLIIGDIHAGDRNFYGKMDEWRIFNKALDQTTIQDWMNVSIIPGHPYYENLVAYYRFDEGEGGTTTDDSPYGETATIHDYVTWGYERGNDLDRGFLPVLQRPNVTFLQGEYDLTITDNIVTEAVGKIKNNVREFEIIPRYGTMLDDSIDVVFSDLYHQAGWAYTYDPEGVLIDSTEVPASGLFASTELNYFKRYPCKYEIMSFVTPYGIYLDLGMEGKTWLFDVTDFEPILKGWKRLSIELGGQRQEDMDIQFWYILGTPPRDVLDINQIWRASSNNYTNLMNDRAYEPRDFYFRPDGEAFKVRSVITGHGQQGEFTQRWHSLNINGDIPEFEWKVWTECADIAIYPQGGTWIFDRAGWCPGDPSDLYEYDITEFVTPGQTHSIDYNLTYASGTSNYQVSNQLVTYGAPNFNLDAAVVNITKPNGENAAFERFNPACGYPVAVIQNTGATTLTSLDLEYNVEGGEVLSYTWTGSLEFLQTIEVELEISDYTFWSGSNNQFSVTISNPNGEADEYAYNNNYTIQFAEVDLYPLGEALTVECKTNNQGYQTSYSLTDMAGNVIFEMDDLENATIYTNEVNLEPGCYKLRIDDTGDNGLDFWYFPNYGTGYLRIKDSDGNILVDIEPDFGKYAVYEFGVVDFTGTREILEKSNIVSVYPNPTAGFVHVNFQGLENHLIDARIFDANMSVLLEKQLCVEGTDFTESISLEKYPSGVYFLELEYDGKTSLKKIVKK